MNGQEGEILELMQQELTQLEKLSLLIDQERTAIVDSNHEALGPAVQGKLEASEELARIEQALQTALRVRGLELTRDSMDTYLKSLARPDSPLALWQKICDLANHCRQRNAANGRIVEANRQAAEEMLRILKGQKPEDRELYDPKGRSVSSPSSHTLAKA